MAKLYWRVKRDGKWTWVAAHVEESFDFKNQDGTITQRFVVEEFE